MYRYTTNTSPHSIGISLFLTRRNRGCLKPRGRLNWAEVYPSKRKHRPYFKEVCNYVCVCVWGGGGGTSLHWNKPPLIPSNFPILPP